MNLMRRSTFIGNVNSINSNSISSFNKETIIQSYSIQDFGNDFFNSKLPKLNHIKRINFYLN